MQVHIAQPTQLILQTKKMEHRIMKQYETIRSQKERQARGPEYDRLDENGQWAPSMKVVLRTVE